MPDILADIDALSAACKQGDIASVASLLERHPDVLDSPDRDTRFPYPESRLWSPLFIAAKHGHLGLVIELLDMGANPVPFEIAELLKQHGATA
jgi:ankyrin repeat protein